MSSYTNIFGGSPVQTATDSFLAINLNVANINLSWPTQFQNVNPNVAKIMDVISTAGGQTLTLPDATKVSVGTDFLIVNVGGANAFNLLKNDSTLLSAIAVGNAIYFYLTDNTTAAGAWRVVPFGGGVAAVTSVNAAVPNATDNANLTVAGGPITAAGTLNFALAGDLLALTRFGGGVGIAVRTGANAWALRQVQPVVNGNISVTNPAGTAGNILLDLQPNLGANGGFNPIASMQIGNILLTANTISTTNLNGDMILAPNGIGQVKSANNFVATSGSLISFSNNDNTNVVSLSASSIGSGGAGYSLAFTWPTVLPTAGQALIYGGTPAGRLAWQAVPTVSGAVLDRRIARFTGTGGQIENSPITLDDSGTLTGVNAITMAGTLTVGTLTLGATNVISTTANGLIFTPATNSNFRTDVYLGNQATPSSNVLYFVSTVNPWLASITASGAMTANLNLSLPPAPPTLNNQIMQGSTTGVLTFSLLQATAALKADMQTATSVILPVVPGVVQYHPGVAKARCNFTTVAGPVISDNYNIASVTRTGTGVYVVNFTTAFAAANYTVAVTVEGVGAFSVAYSARATNNVQVNIYASVGGAAADPTAASFVAYGTQ